MLAFLVWDPQKEIFSFSLPLLGRPLVWYGLCFAIGFFLAYVLFFFQLKKILPRSKAKKIAEGILSYALLGVILGARFFDVIFYQDWHLIYTKPWTLFQPWEGGLASHGGVAGLLLALAIFHKKHRTIFEKISFVKLLDLLCLPSAALAGCIRIGNFINQEIVGTPTTLPWAVIFCHPADGCSAVPRHPVQLYEAFFYFLLAVGLFAFHKKLLKYQSGKTVGLFLTVVFAFRFCIEYVKVEQSAQISNTCFISMGQILSIPFVLIGIFLLLRKNK